MDMDENKLRRIIREEQKRATDEKKKAQSNDTRSISSHLDEVGRISDDFNSKLRRLEELTGKNLSDLKYKKQEEKASFAESNGCFILIAIFAAFAFWIGWQIFVK
jgi:hypothetical protein